MAASPLVNRRDGSFFSTLLARRHLMRATLALAFAAALVSWAPSSMAGRAEGDKEHVGSGGADDVDHAGICFRRRSHHRGNIDAGDLKSWVALLEGCCGGRRDTWLGAEKEHSVAFCRGERGAFTDEINAGNPFWQAAAHQPGSPHQGHAVGDGERSGVQDRTKGEIRAGETEEV